MWSVSQSLADHQEHVELLLEDLLLEDHNLEDREDEVQERAVKTIRIDKARNAFNTHELPQLRCKRFTMEYVNGQFRYCEKNVQRESQLEHKC